jgi:tungstate transport system ATP-binding protein
VKGAPVLTLREVVVRYPTGWTLTVPLLHVYGGEVLGVIGPNGSGKSTLLRVLALLQPPTAGEVWFRGRTVTVARGLEARRRMAVVFQRPWLADTTVLANAALGLWFRHVPAPERDARALHWLERLGIAALARRPARTLSGGEAQRAALARALAVAPEVLLLDEPFAGLDAPTRSALMADLAAVLRAEGTTTVLVTHDRDEVRALADRVAVLVAGRLRQLGPTGEVFGAPADEEVARLVGLETVVEGEVTGSSAGAIFVDVAGRKLEVAGAAHVGQRVRVGIRPEDVTLVQPPGGLPLSSARNQLAGTVVRVVPGSSVRVTVDVGFPLVAAVTPRSAEDLGLRPGTAVVAVFKASAVHLLAPTGGPGRLDTVAGEGL